MNTLDKGLVIGKTMTIEANGKTISNIAGQKSHNIKYLINRYRLKILGYMKGIFPQILLWYP